MKIVAFPLALLACSATAQSPDEIAPPGCEYGSPHPDAPPEMAQFDFLIGDYSIVVSRWVEGEWQAVPVAGYGPARWNGRYILGGMAIEDEWYDKDPGIDSMATRGVNVRMWDAEAAEWDMMWVYTGNRAVTDLRAKVIGDRLEMWQVTPYRPNFRAYFERVDADRWNRITLMPDAEGRWNPTVRLEATRIPCG